MTEKQNSLEKKVAELSSNTGVALLAILIAFAVVAWLFIEQDSGVSALEEQQENASWECAEWKNESYYIQSGDDSCSRARNLFSAYCHDLKNISASMPKDKHGELIVDCYGAKGFFESAHCRSCVREVLVRKVTKDG